MYKVKNELRPKIMLNLFKEVTHPYNFRNGLICGSYKIKTTSSYRNHHLPWFKIWSNIPDEIRESASLETFLQKNQDSCPCRICKKYIANVGFVDLS